MAVLTTDILLRGIRRDEVFEWMGDTGNQRKILDGAFDEIKELGPGQYDLVFTAPVKKRTLGYRFTGLDDSHAGRRVLVTTSGKRTTGQMSFSLRTMKPSSNTLVTLHMDIPTNMIEGAIFDNLVRKPLELCCVKVLENLSNIIPRTVGSAAGKDGAED